MVNTDAHTDNVGRLESLGGACGGRAGPEGTGGLCQVRKGRHHQAPARPGRKGQPRMGVVVKVKLFFSVHTTL